MNNHIKKFNENNKNDSIYAITDSFNKVSEELELLNKRLGWWSAGKNEEFNKLESEISQMKIKLDDLLNKFNNLTKK